METNDGYQQRIRWKRRKRSVSVPPEQRRWGRNYNCGGGLQCGRMQLEAKQQSDVM